MSAETISSAATQKTDTRGFENKISRLVIESTDVPGKSGTLTPDLYERESEKFQALMDETRELATVAHREEFAGIVRHMVKRLSGEEDGKPKRFQASMLERMG